MSRWRSRFNPDDPRSKKEPISVTMTAGAIEFIRTEIKGTHDTRSSYVEKMFWIGVREWGIAQDLKAKADHTKKPLSNE